LGPSAAETPYVRFGFSISKKTAKRAHQRNKIKRRLREIVRILIIPRVRSGMDCDTILTVRQPSLTLSFAELTREVEGIFQATGLMRDET
jgi:ribonuclease P protein component